MTFDSLRINHLRRGGALTALALLGVTITANCATDEDTSTLDSEEDVATAESALSTELASGQRLDLLDLGLISAVDIASCSDGVLYSTRADGTLWFNQQGGVGAWTQVTAGTPGMKIACDRAHLYAMNDQGILFHAELRRDSQLLVDANDPSHYPWKTSYSGVALGVPPGTTDIQSGFGNIYAVAFNDATQTSTIWASEFDDVMHAGGYRQGAATTWKLLQSNVALSHVAGVGSLSLLTPAPALSAPLTNRAFGLVPNHELRFSDGLLKGTFDWTWFDNFGKNVTNITADSPNVVFALTSQTSFGFTIKHLLRFQFTETNCSDGKDNDANGLVDALDPACQQSLGDAFCQAHPDGGSCIQSIQNTNGFNRAFIDCNGTSAEVEPGLCMTTKGGGYLLPPSAIHTPEPAGMGHYCNVIAPDGSWDLSWTGTDPCAALLANSPQSKIVRAGIYSTTERNDVLIQCDQGVAYRYTKDGQAPLWLAKNAVGSAGKNCIVTAAPRSLPVFKSPLPPTAWLPDSVPYSRHFKMGHRFDHAPNCATGDANCPCQEQDNDCGLDLSDFGNESGVADDVDSRGAAITHYRRDQNGYDFLVGEGTPVIAVASGVVIASRRKDVSGDGFGTPFQAEITIQHQVGGDPRYSEGFTSYHAHLRQRLVVEGETVAAGQIIGYVGTSGDSSEPHVHFTLVRTSNTNARKVNAPEFGYHFAYDPGPNPDALAGSVDPFGWNAPEGMDPSGYFYRNAMNPYGGDVQGYGAWSPKAWPADQTPPFPE